MKKLNFKILLLVGLTALAVLLQYSLWFGDNSISTLKETRMLIEEEKQRNFELAKRNDELKAQLIDLRTGNETMEEMARMELGLVKEGETFYRVIESDSTDTATQ